LAVFRNLFFSKYFFIFFRNLEGVPVVVEKKRDLDRQIRVRVFAAIRYCPGLKVLGVVLQLL
jgi:hypothetical protein